MYLVGSHQTVACFISHERMWELHPECMLEWYINVWQKAAQSGRIPDHSKESPLE